MAAGDAGGRVDRSAVLDILRITAPIYLCMAVGWVATRLGMFSRPDIDVIGRVVMNVCMPALIFLSMARRPLGAAGDATYLPAYALTSLGALLFGYLWSRRVNRTPRVGAAFDAMGTGGANSGFVGFPLLMVVMPSVAGVVFGMNVLVESLVTIPLCFFWAERGGAAGGFFGSMRRAVGSMLRMPVFIGMICGLVVAAAGWTLPDVLVVPLDLFGRATTGLALFAVGGMMVGLTVRGHLARVVAVSLGKLLVMPALAWGAALGLAAAGMPPLQGEMLAALVLSAAMPAWTSSAVFAARYGETVVPPAVQLVTTVASFATLSGLLAVLL